MAILSAFSRQPWRITVSLDSAPSTTPSDYVVTRLDNGATGVTITNAFLVGSNVVELTTSETLFPGLIYVLTYQVGPTIQLDYTLPLVGTEVPQVGDEDPEAEAFGIDIDWFADVLQGNGDCPTIRGRQCLVNDLASVCLIQKGEIFHRPDVGVGAKLFVNAPNLPVTIGQLTGSIKREWAKDPRVKQGGITTQVDVSTAGQISISGKIQPIAIGDELQVKIPGGAT